MKIMFASFNRKNKLKRQDILNNISKYTSTMIDENRILKRTNRIKNVSNNNAGTIDFGKGNIKKYKCDKDKSFFGLLCVAKNNLKKFDKNNNFNLNENKEKHIFNKESSYNIESIYQKHKRSGNNLFIDNNKIKFSFIKLSVFSIIIMLLFAFLLNNVSSVNNLVLKFASNVHEDDIDISPSNIAKLYGIYNDSNYIINTEKIEVAKEEKEEPKNENIDEIELIDKNAILENKAVFMSSEKKPSAVVTEETKTLQRINLGTMKILNYSSTRNINFEELLEKNITLTKASDKILLYNTHTSESYSNSEKYQFEYSGGTMRSLDAKYNMLAIAKELNSNLKEKGFYSIHNTTPHDYGTYTSAYAKLRVTVQEALSQMQGAGIVIDVHRDATANLAYRPVANVNGIEVAQLMFVMGVGSNSVKNPNWQDNIALAIQIQLLADKIYPGLFKPMMIRNSVYNQDLNKYSMLIEFGATGNTIEEVKLSTRCLTNLLNIMYKD